MVYYCDCHSNCMKVIKISLVQLAEKVTEYSKKGLTIQLIHPTCIPHKGKELLEKTADYTILGYLKCQSSDRKTFKQTA